MAPRGFRRAFIRTLLLLQLFFSGGRGMKSVAFDQIDPFLVLQAPAAYAQKLVISVKLSTLYIFALLNELMSNRLGF
jgi:hypothetical protein